MIQQHNDAMLVLIEKHRATQAGILQTASANLLSLRDGPPDVLAIADGRPPHDIQGCPYADGWHADDEIVCTSNSFTVNNTARSVMTTLQQDAHLILAVPDVAEPPACEIDVLIQFRDGSQCYAGLRTNCPADWEPRRECGRADWLRWRQERREMR